MSSTAVKEPFKPPVIGEMRGPHSTTVGHYANGQSAPNGQLGVQFAVYGPKGWLIVSKHWLHAAEARQIAEEWRTKVMAEMVKGL